MNLININAITNIVVVGKKRVKNYKWSEHEHGFLCTDRSGINMARVMERDTVRNSIKYHSEGEVLFKNPHIYLNYVGDSYNVFYFKSKKKAKFAAMRLTKVDKFFSDELINNLGGKCFKN